MKRHQPPVAPVPLHLTHQEIISQIAGLYAIPISLLTHTSRRKQHFYTEVRGVAAWVLRKCCGTKLRAVAYDLRFSTHSAVLRIVCAVDHQSQVDPDFRERLEAILTTLLSKQKPNPGANQVGQRESLA